MINQTIEVGLNDKYLNINNNIIGLDGSFFHAGLTRIINSDTEIALELMYHNEDDDFIIGEGETIYAFIKEYNLNDRIEVNTTSKQKDMPHPYVSLVGNFKATIYS